jgi:hypothetical protein
MEAKDFKILVACETSGAVRNAFRDAGFYAVSCDILPAETPGIHFQCDVMELLYDWEFEWDLAIMHPPCTYLSSSGLHWNGRVPGRKEKTDAAIEFVKKMMAAPKVKRWAIENPIGCISSRIRKPDQIIQPYQFGEDASKATCLWLNGVPKLAHTEYFPPRIVNGKKRWGNQTDSGQNKLAPSEDRWKERSKTYPGIAKAMVEQWGSFLIAGHGKEKPSQKNLLFQSSIVFQQQGYCA